MTVCLTPLNVRRCCHLVVFERSSLHLWKCPRHVAGRNRDGTVSFFFLVPSRRNCRTDFSSCVHAFSQQTEGFILEILKLIFRASVRWNFFAVPLFLYIHKHLSLKIAGTTVYTTKNEICAIFWSGLDYLTV